MARDWHELFKSWAKPPSQTEESKGSNAANMIKKAVRETGILDGRNFAAYPTGSYHNNTNIRLGSDVDIALVLRDAMWCTFPAGRRLEDFGLTQSAEYGLKEFRRDIGEALKRKFGHAVSQGNKTFDIQGNNYRLPADATPFLLHRRYSGERNSDGSWSYVEGVEMRPLNDPSKRIVNWHGQHYDSGVSKNIETGRRFKRVARILKKLKVDMKESGSASAKICTTRVPSFLLECLAYNVGSECYNKVEGSYYEDVRAVVVAAWNATKDASRAGNLSEVSGLKRLFGSHQGWTREDAHSFLAHAWQHVGFK